MGWRMLLHCILAIIAPTSTPEPVHQTVVLSTAEAVQCQTELIGWVTG